MTGAASRMLLSIILGAKAVVMTHPCRPSSYVTCIQVLSAVRPTILKGAMAFTLRITALVPSGAGYTSTFWSRGSVVQSRRDGRLGNGNDARCVDRPHRQCRHGRCDNLRKFCRGGFGILRGGLRAARRAQNQDDDEGSEGGLVKALIMQPHCFRLTDRKLRSHDNLRSGRRSRVRVKRHAAVGADFSASTHPVLIFANSQQIKNRRYFCRGAAMLRPFLMIHH